MMHLSSETLYFLERIPFNSFFETEARFGCKTSIVYTLIMTYKYKPSGDASEGGFS